MPKYNIVNVNLFIERARFEEWLTWASSVQRKSLNEIETETVATLLLFYPSFNAFSNMDTIAFMRW